MEAETTDSYILPAKKLQSWLLLHIMRENRICDTHVYTRLGNEKSSVKTWNRIW